MNTTLSPTDRRILTEQLGREPRGACDVEARCPAGHPLVVKVYPLVGQGPARTPFPTLFWLSCPAVVKEISRLEAVGWIRRLEDQISGDPVLATSLAADHQRYAQERWQLVSAADRQLAQQRGFAGVLREQGIGGVISSRHLKCLHLHYAHHLARGNTVGRLLEASFAVPPCPAPSP